MGEDDDDKPKRRDKSDKRKASKDSHSKSPRRGGALTTDDDNDATTEDNTSVASDGDDKKKKKGGTSSKGKSKKGKGKGSGSKNKGGKGSKGKSSTKKSSGGKKKGASDSEGEGGGGGGGLCCFGGGGGGGGGKKSSKKGSKGSKKGSKGKTARRPTRKTVVEEDVEKARSPSVSSVSSRKSPSVSSVSSRKSSKEVESLGPRKSSKASIAESLNSRRVVFNEAVAVKEIPNKEVVKAAEHARTLPGYVSNEDGFPQHYYPGGDPFVAGSESSNEFNDLRGVSRSDQSLHEEMSVAGSEQGAKSPPFPVGVLGECGDNASRTGSLMSERNASLRVNNINASASACSSRSPSASRSRSRDQGTGSDVKSMKSFTLDEDARLFRPDRCYARPELIAMMERLVYGINNRECLKARYDEESTRLSMSTEYQGEKIGNLNQKLERLGCDQEDLDVALKESADHLTQNLLQLNRERKRIAGAVDLREDFDKFLQQQISTKTRFFQDYAQMLGKLEGLFEDSTLQWVQRETMLSTEAEALDRVRRSPEKELRQLQVELQKQEANYAARAAQNSKLSQVVEKELEKYARRQQNILRYNEKRIRALEGCVRTMQLDREVMYGEIAENRHRLKEVVEGRLGALMDKVHSYKVLLRSVREEIEAVLGSARPEQAIKVSTMLSSYSRALAALDLCALETQVKAAKQICDRAEQAFRKKNLQKKDLVEIRQTFVDSQKQTMLDSEDEYFLMEPVDVPGIESNANFQRSLDDFTKEFEFASGAATAPKVFALSPEKSFKEHEDLPTFGRRLSPEPLPCGPCNDVSHEEVHPTYETCSEPRTECDRVADAVPTACSEKTPPGSKRRAVLNSLSMRSSRNIGNALKKFTHVGKR